MPRLEQQFCMACALQAGKLNVLIALVKICITSCEMKAKWWSWGFMHHKPSSVSSFIPRADSGVVGLHIIKVSPASASKHMFSASSESFSLAACVFSLLFCTSYNNFCSWLPLLHGLLTMASDGGAFLWVKAEPTVLSKCSVSKKFRS